jgi:hypothetical protein
MSRLNARGLKKFWVDETPSGTVNGSNTSFSLAQLPLENDSVELYQDGLKLTYTTDYTISGTTITMVTAPVVGQTLRANYIRNDGE